MADEVLLSAFVVVVIGGLGSVARRRRSADSCSAWSRASARTTSSAEYQTAFGFVALVAVLVLRPGGLLGVNARRVA